MGQAFLASYLIGLREGLEITLVVSILIAYTETTLLADTQSRELFEAITSVVAVVLVTWMIFWMRRTARRLKGELTGKLESALGVGGLAIAGIALVSVSAGIATSVLIGFGLYAGAIRINLQKFFTVSGVLLVFVATGIFKYGI